jgi:tetratricopeptide (TPR) repeat protein
MVTHIRQHLAQIESSGLIRLAASEPDLEYFFRHALVQEAAYHSLVKRDRQQLHRAVGETLEGSFSDHQDLTPLLAHHFHEAGDDERALKYFALAGDAAARVYANAEAAIHYARALEIARRPPAADAALLVHLYASLGQALELSSRYAEALATYTEWLSLARTRGDPNMEYAALMALAKIHSIASPVHNPTQAHGLLEQALALSRATSDRAAEARVLWNLMILLLYGGGDARRATAYGEEALAIARELDLREQLAFTLNDLTYAYMATHQYPQAQAALEEALRLWRELNNLPMLVDGLCNLVIIHYRAGNFDQAIAAGEEGLRISRSIGNLWGQAGSQFFVGNVYLERGQLGRAVAALEAAIRLGEQAGHMAAVISASSDLGWVYGVLGDVERGLELVRQAQGRAVDLPILRLWPTAPKARLYLLEGDLTSAEAALQEGHHELKPEGLQMFTPILLRLAEGELAFARQDYERVVALMDSLMDWLQQHQSRAFVPHALHLKGRALLASGRVDEARAALSVARSEAAAIDGRMILWQILSALSEAEAAQGNHAEAQALRQQAREIVAYVADHCPPELRASFLAWPHVRAASDPP